MKEFIRIDAKDNVAVAIVNLKSTQVVSGVKLKEDIDAGHKFALSSIKCGEFVIKYGYSIGKATADIDAGTWVHTHNLKTNLKEEESYSYNPQSSQSHAKEFENLTFNGYKRKNGDVGIRNELWIVPLVGCINETSRLIVEKFKQTHDVSKIDGIHVLSHPYGCSQLGDDHQNTKTILQDLVKHPNAGGVLVFSLGCENNQMKPFRDTLGDYDEDRVKFLIAQEVKDEIAEGVNLLSQLLSKMENDRRQTVPLSSLKVGLKCGGSDGLSGITANPLIGRFADFLINRGGCAVLTEVPEMFGAEQILMDRCKDENVFGKCVNLINNFKQYFIKNDQQIYENPSPGNKKGGISTLEDKSLGCTQKSGTSLICDVLNYGERIKERGLSLLYCPGNDLVAMTGLGASGCQIVLFSTGRGNPSGSFYPTYKISSNSELFKNKPHWIDFDAGRLLDDNASQDDVLLSFAKDIIEICNGKKTKAEENNFKDLTIFKTGVTL